jgi:hypothetical protein
LYHFLSNILSLPVGQLFKAISEPRVADGKEKKAGLSIIEKELTEKNKKLEEELAVTKHQLRTAREDIANLQVSHSSY